LATVAYRAVRPVRRRSASRRLGNAGPGTYLFLLLVAAGSMFPLYWSLVVASHDNSAIGAYPPVLTPGPHLWSNIHRLFTAGIVNVDFWKALINSMIVASVVTFTVVLFCALAGFAFAKLEFRGRKWLLLTVVATMLVPEIGRASCRERV